MGPGQNNSRCCPGDAMVKEALFEAKEKGRAKQKKKGQWHLMVRCGIGGVGGFWVCWCSRWFRPEQLHAEPPTVSLIYHLHTNARQNSPNMAK